MPTLQVKPKPHEDTEYKLQRSCIRLTAVFSLENTVFNYDQCILCLKSWQAAFLLSNPVPWAVAFVCILLVYMFFSCRLPVFANTDTCDKLMTVFLVSVPDHGWDPNTDSLAVQTEDWSQVQKRYSSLFFHHSQVSLTEHPCLVCCSPLLCNWSVM